MSNALRFMAVLADNPGVTAIPNHEPSFWLRGRLVDLHTRWAAGQMLGCREVFAPTPDTLLVVALWMPEVMVCRSCAPEILKTAAASDLTCDRCATCDRDTRSVAILEQGVVVAFGLCPGCYRREIPS
ncbi:hypothetical protein [Phycicoccus sp.]|uniref:hypothetical protein n=1 Tax=Phycicoccus sp. TaxID=1902410 RepID=UPI002BA4E770|nr:hypothetical protein [Phycicoccus sp.]HMM96714.1 hypothetical protein [Phycicoccus sp.]